MEKKCNGCSIENKGTNIPFVVYQATAARQERQIRRMWIVVLLLICALIGTNLAWIIYNSQFEIVEESVMVEQENDNGDIPQSVV
jgi:ABC-type phosphate transport system permease subunit